MTFIPNPRYAALYFLFLFSSISVFAQDYKLRSDFGSNWFNGQPSYDLANDARYCPPNGATVDCYTLQATNSSTFFAIGADNCPGDDMCNRWNNGAVVVNSIQTYTQGCCNTGVSQLTSAATVGNYYTICIEQNGYNDVQGIVHETTTEPQEFTHVSAIENRVVGCLSGPLAASENAYIRFSTDGGTTWITEMATVNVMGCFDHSLAGVAAGVPFEFYAITSTLGTIAAVDANPDLAALRHYGSDVNGQASGPGCPRMTNFLLKDTTSFGCLTEGGVTATIDATIDAGGYLHVTEALYAYPFTGGSATSSDFIGESSAKHAYTGNTSFNYCGDWIDLNTTNQSADIENFFVTWDQDHLYLLVEGPTAYHGPDNMDLFVAIDTDNDVAPHPYGNTVTLGNTAAPWQKRVDFNGWSPDFFAIAENPGFAALAGTGGGFGTLATDVNINATAACPSFEFSTSQATRVTEFRIPWTLIGGAPDKACGTKMNFAVYTTYEGDDFDTYDTAPGLGQGHGKPFEQVGDTPWDGDHFGGKLDPVTGVNDGTYTYGESWNGDPFDSRVRDQGPGDNVSCGQQPGSDNAQTNGGDDADFDTVEGYYGITNVGQITYAITAIDFPADTTVLCTVSPPPPLIAPGVNIPYNPAIHTFITVKDSGSCYSPTFDVALTITERGLAFDSVCAPVCIGLQEFIDINYTITWNDKMVQPSVPCAAPVLADTLINGMTTVTRAPVDGSGPCTNALPLELLSFEATLVGDEVALNWVTATEENVSHFEIWRSQDGVNFERHLTRNAAGNSLVEQQYLAMDKALEVGVLKYYYRLIGVDFDGSLTESEIRVVNITNKSLDVTIHPNPSSGMIQIMVASDDELVSLDLYAINGKLLSSHDLDSNKELNLDLSNYPKGSYLVRAKTTNESITTRFTLK